MKNLAGHLAVFLFLLSACESEAPVEETTLVIDGPNVERGAYLVRGAMGCGHCHTPGGVQKGNGVAELSGDTWGAGEFQMTIPNLTPSSETGIGAWSEDEIVTTITTGERPDGTRIMTLMPWKFYANLSENDARSIAKFLKSIPAVNNPIPRNPVGGTIEDLDRKAPYAPPADPSDTLAYGRYLAGLGHCLACHTKGGDFENSLGAGGSVFDLGDVVAVSANITPHPEDGIPHYTIEDFKTLFKTGMRPNGTRVMPLMGIDFFKNMTDEDMEAIATYLKSLEPKPTPLGE